MTLARLCCQAKEEEEACKQAGVRSCLSPIRNHLFPCRVGLHDAMK